jgi:ankyrin repeat protein
VCSDELQQWLGQHTLEEVHGRDQYGWSALHHVAQNSRSDQAAERIFDELCTHGWSPEQVNVATGKEPKSMHLPKGWTALHLLANGRDPWAQRGRMAAKLLMMKANPMLSTETGATPLHTAAGTANFHVANVLLSDPGVNVNSKNEKSKTPFDVACSNRKMRDLIARVGGRPSIDPASCKSAQTARGREHVSEARMKRAAEWRNRF